MLRTLTLKALLRDDVCNGEDHAGSDHPGGEGTAVEQGRVPAPKAEVRHGGVKGLVYAQQGVDVFRYSYCIYYHIYLSESGFVCGYRKFRVD